MFCSVFNLLTSSRRHDGVRCSSYVRYRHGDLNLVQFVTKGFDQYSQLGPMASLLAQHPHVVKYFFYKIRRNCDFGEQSLFEESESCIILLTTSVPTDDLSSFLVDILPEYAAMGNMEMLDWFYSRLEDSVVLPRVPSKGKIANTFFFFP